MAQPNVPVDVTSDVKLIVTPSARDKGVAFCLDYNDIPYEAYVGDMGLVEELKTLLASENKHLELSGGQIKLRDKKFPQRVRLTYAAK